MFQLQFTCRRLKKDNGVLELKHIEECTRLRARIADLEGQNKQLTDELIAIGKDMHDALERQAARHSEELRRMMDVLAQAGNQGNKDPLAKVAPKFLQVKSRYISF